RYASMQPVQQELEECRARITAARGINLGLLWAQRKKPAIAIPVLLGLVMLVGVVGWWIHREVQIRWARNEALPQIARLIEAEKIGDAYALAAQAERYIPRDPTLAKYWDSMSYSIPIVPVSNFSARGPSQVGSYQGVSRFGTYDMAGNVKEWVWNKESSGK